MQKPFAIRLCLLGAIVLVCRSGLAAPELEALPEDVRQQIAATCLSVHFTQGRDAYRDCVAAEVQNRRDSSQPVIRFDEQFMISQACEAADEACERIQRQSLDSLPYPPLEQLGADERHLILRDCQRQHAGSDVLDYRRCLVEQVALLGIEPRPALGTLSVADRNRLQAECAETVDSAVALRRCLVDSAGAAERDPTVTSSTLALQSALDAAAENQPAAAEDSAGPLALESDGTASELTDPASQSNTASDATGMDADTARNTSSQSTADGSDEPPGTTAGGGLLERASSAVESLGLPGGNGAIIVVIVAIALLLVMLAVLLLRRRRQTRFDDYYTATERVSGTSSGAEAARSAATYASDNDIKNDDDILDSLDRELADRIAPAMGHRHHERAATVSGRAAAHEVDDYHEDDDYPEVDETAVTRMAPEVWGNDVMEIEPMEDELDSLQMSGPSEFARWLMQQTEDDRLTACFELLIYWIAYADGRYHPALRKRLFTERDLNGLDLIKRWVLQQDVQAFADALQYLQEESTRLQRRQILDLLMALLTAENSTTPVQVTVLRLLGDAFGIGAQQLEIDFEQAFGHPLPPLPRPDRLAWWERQTPEAVERWARSGLTTVDEHTRYRELLGLAEDFREVDVMRAYRRAAKRCHPDRFSELGPRARALAVRRHEKFEEARDRLLGVLV